MSPATIALIILAIVVSLITFILREPRTGVIAGVVFLLAAGIAFALKKETVASLIANNAFYFLALGMLLLLIQHIRRKA